MNTKKFKQFTLEDRIVIENLIMNGGNCKQISALLCKSESSLRRELKRNRIIQERHYFNNPRPFTCKKIDRFPYVCNACPKLKSCRLLKYFYRSKDAHENAQNILSYSRAISHFDDDTFELINNVLTRGVEMGQPVSHIIKANKLPVSESTIYRWINEGITSVTRMELQKAIRYDKNVKPVRRIKDYSYRIGRKYEDFLKFRQKYPGINVIEMDTVEGLKSDSKFILTFVCVKSKMFFARLMENQKAKTMVEQLNIIESILGIEVFRLIFGCIVTDNGPEFRLAEEIEFSPFTGERRTHVFYCDPNRSDQKGTIERKHSDLRLIIPKKKSIDFLTQEKVDLSVSHVNAIMRPDLNYRSTFEFASLLHSDEILKQLGIQNVPPKDVHLKPSLLK